MKNIILYMNLNEMAFLIAGLDEILETQNRIIKYNEEATEEMKLQASITIEDIKILQGELISSKRTAIAESTFSNPIANNQEDIK